MSIWWEVADMRNLLSAGFARLGKNTAFYLTASAMLIIAAVMMLISSRAALRNTSDYVFTLEQHYFDLTAYMGFFLAAFIALFIGTEYSDGTIRSKLTVGHARGSIYLSNLFVCAIASMVFIAAGMVGGLVGVPVLGFWTLGAAEVATAFVIAFLAGIALTAVLMVVSMLTSNRAAGVVICIFLFLGLLLLASFLYNNLLEPEMHSGMIITIDGIQAAPPEPNPTYVAEPLRSVYIALLNILPTGQMALLANISDSAQEGLTIYPLQIAGSFLVIALGTGTGLLLFRRKDLK